MSLNVILLLYIMIVTCSPVEASLCPTQNQSAELRFTKDLGSLDYVRFGHSIHVLCCAEGYTNITWSKNVNGAWQIFPSSTSQDNSPEILYNRQVLLFSDVNFSDAATYKCTVYGKSTSISHEIKIVVEKCDKLARGPYFIAPVPQNKTIYSYGGSVTFPCNGYFGCNEPGDGDMVLWTVEGSREMNLTRISSRYIVNKTGATSSHNNSTLGATLTINSVRKEDVERTFVCIIASPQIKAGQSYKIVKIFKKDKPLEAWKLGLIIGSSALMIVLLGLCLRYLYGPRIQLFCSSRLDLCGPKPIDDEVIVYNLFIYHGDEDETKAQEIKQYLTNKGYTVFIAADIEGNANIMHKVFEKAAESALAVFLYSKALRDDDLANFFLQSMIRSRRGKRILILEVEAYEPKKIRQWQEVHADNIRALREQYNNEQEHNINDDLDNHIEHNIEIGTDVTEQMGDDLQFWKVLPRIKVPKDNQKGRKVNNFWCALQNKIPKFPSQKQRAGRRQEVEQGRFSIERPLLNSTRESETLTPQSIINNGGELSPSGNDVFTFGDSNELVENLPDTNRIKDSQNLIEFEEETNLIDEKVRNNAREFASNTTDSNHDYFNVKCELPEGRGNNLLNHVDDQFNERSDAVPADGEGSYNLGHHVTKSENMGKNREEEKSKEYIFTMSGEEPKSGSFDNESGDSGGNYSGRGMRNTSLDSGGSSHYGMVSSHSSGFSDFNSEGSLSPPVGNSLEAYCEHANGIANNGHTRAKLIVTSPGQRADSCSPESGYNTSPDRILSNDSYLPQINENT